VEAWAREERGPSTPWTGEEGSTAFRMALGGVIALVVLACALLVARQLLLGVIAATIVLVAFYVALSVS
jgi:hypothetical protein